MKDFKSVEENVKQVLEYYPVLRDKSCNDVMVAYALEFTDHEVQDIKIFSNILKDLPASSTIVRMLAKVRGDYPELDTRVSKDNLKKDMEEYLKQSIS